MSCTSFKGSTSAFIVTFGARVTCFVKVSEIDASAEVTWEDRRATAIGANSAATIA